MHSRKTNSKTSSVGLQSSELPGSAEYASLIIRLWHGSGGETGGEIRDWRSEVEHIQSGGVWEYASIAELESFLERFLRQLGGAGQAD
jgi:hypothetical protein